MLFGDLIVVCVGDKLGMKATEKRNHSAKCKVFFLVEVDFGIVFVQDLTLMGIRRFFKPLN